ncbi:hypothetical protein AKJ57_00230 [candidate division MSBL1 archaeon SCGC-AAA259A05]|uniref:Uncharacterized protein n=1 Tax=candidate division MSBL1 archaeon SCGC-AAA259A05 TaxID=1698259 RepID=A0A133UC17_9EURY|nr:hypothetical protein AKJ57_00230 [candidate division MSBL1 archaeon SCGC-AAA259A05]
MKLHISKQKEVRGEMINTVVRLLSSIVGFMGYGGLTEATVGGIKIALIVGVVGAFLNFYSVSKLLESS